MIKKSLAVATLTALMASAAVAQVVEPQGLETIGKPRAEEMGFQPASTSLMQDIVWLDSLIHGIMVVIVLFVTLLLAWCIIRYNGKSNPNPARFTHNTPIEVTWTIVPVIILVFIGSFSLPVLFDQQEIPEADVTIKATGNQWYWTHEYVDHEFGFDSFLLPKEELADYGYAEDEYLLATDNAVVVPVDKTIVVQVTAADVIHSWAMPAFGVKQDGVPGRLAELWFKPEREGIFFGQCSELCGKDHAYMPITIKVVSQSEYEAWLDSAITEYAGIPREVKVASAD